MPYYSDEKFEHFRDELLPYFRSWKRHGIYFGVSSSRRWLAHAGTLFPAAHIIIDGEWHYASEQMPETICASVSGEASHYRFPHSWNDPRKRGCLNPRFLDPGQLLREHTFPAVQNLGLRPARVVFTIHPVYLTEGLSPEHFNRKLDSFLSALPRSYAYAIRCLAPQFLLPPYFETLRKHDAVHVLDDLVAPLLDQVQSPFITGGGGSVVLTDASDDPDWRLAIAHLTRRCLRERRMLYCFARDSADIPVLSHLHSLMQSMDADLARLSIIRKHSAA